ncbi:hypothetical protein ACFPRL_27475 [Pseudoclavibacter helvolus]
MGGTSGVDRGSGDRGYSPGADRHRSSVAWFQVREPARASRRLVASRACARCPW